jgi:hypothetical protein
MHGKRNIDADNLNNCVEIDYTQQIKSRKKKEKLAWAYLRSPHPEYSKAGFQILYDLLRYDSKNERARKYLAEMGYSYFPGYHKEFLKRPTCASMSNDKQFIALGNWKTIQVLDIKSKKIIHTFSISHQVTQLMWLDDKILYIANEKLMVTSLTTFIHVKFPSDGDVLRISPSGKSILVKKISRSGESHLQLCAIDIQNSKSVGQSIILPSLVIQEYDTITTSWSDDESKVIIRNKNTWTDGVWIFHTQSGKVLGTHEETEANIQYHIGSSCYIRYDFDNLKCDVFSYSNELISSFDLSDIPVDSSLKEIASEKGGTPWIPEKKRELPEYYLLLEVNTDMVNFLSKNSMLIISWDISTGKHSITEPKGHKSNLAPRTEYPEAIRIDSDTWIVRRPLATEKKHEPSWWEYGKYGFEEDEYFEARMTYWSDLSHPPNEQLSLLTDIEGWELADIDTISINTEHEPLFEQAAFTHGGKDIAAVMRETRRYKAIPDWHSEMFIRFFNIHDGNEYMNKWDLIPLENNVNSSGGDESNQGYEKVHSTWDLNSITNLVFSHDNRYLALGGNFTDNTGFGGDFLTGGAIVLDLKKKEEHTFIVDPFIDQYSDLREEDPELFGSIGLYPFLGIDWDNRDLLAVFPEHTFAYSIPDYLYKGTMPTFVQKDRSKTFVVGFERVIATHNEFYCPISKHVIHSTISRPSHLEMMAGKIGKESPEMKLKIRAPKDIDNLNDTYSPEHKFGIRMNPKRQWFVTFHENELTVFSVKSKKRIASVTLDDQILDVQINPKNPAIMVLSKGALQYLTLPHLKEIQQFPLPNLLTDVRHNWFLNWDSRGEKLAVFGRGLWIINLSEVMKNLVISPTYDKG